MNSDGDPSVSGPIGNPKWANLTPEQRCRAHKTNGEPCSRPPVSGATVCTHHGGRAPQVKAKAKRRLEEAADREARELLKMSTDATSESVRLSAINSALDRAGINAPTRAEVEVSAKPWENVLQGMAEQVAAGSRAQSRAARGEQPEPGPPAPTRAEALEASDQDSNVIDGEVVPEAHHCGGCGRKFPDELPPGIAEYPERCADCR